MDTIHLNKGKQSEIELSWMDTIHLNKGKPAVMLGRKASGPGVTEDSGAAR